jgi:hypothetical protein
MGDDTVLMMSRQLALGETAVDLQLKRAGVRVAMILNSAFVR